jgi:hypothetical protein
MCIIQDISKKLGVLFLSLVIGQMSIWAQTTQNVSGGAANSVYHFLTLPYSAKATALGGLNISSLSSDLGLAMYNPSLLTSDLDHQLQVGVKPYLSDIKQYDVNGAYWIASKNRMLGWGVHYMDYGSTNMTDVAGNNLGDFRPNDYSIQVSLAGQYTQSIYIGSTLKLIQSNYGLYKSSGLAMDIGLRYRSLNELSQVCILVNNIGTQIKSYVSKEDLPFNLVVGWTKKLEHAPVQFSITAEKLSLWKLAYNDTTFNQQQGFASPASLQHLINHFIVAGELFIGKQASVQLGYNFMRRFDLNIQGQQNWMNGFSTGLDLRFNKIQFQFGNAFFQKNSYHHFSLFYQLRKN